MSQRIQLKFSPQEAANTDWVVQQFKRAGGYSHETPGIVVIFRKKSLDARGKLPFFLISADVYSEDEIPEVIKSWNDMNEAANLN